MSVDPGRRAAGDRQQGIHRRLAGDARLRARRPWSIPELAYPTYAIGARLAGATAVAADGLAARSAPGAVTLVWVNSPSNPTGRVLPAGAPAQDGGLGAGERGAVIAADECYLGLGWDAEPVSVAAPRRCAASPPTDVLAVHSLSKRSEHGRLPGGVRHR